MKTERTDFGSRLIAAEPLATDSREKLQQEIHDMFVRELTTPRRIFIGLVGVVALGSAAVCGFLAVTEPTLPLVARIGLGTGTLFGLAWTAMAARIVRRGSINMKVDHNLMAVMVWVFTVLMMVFFLIVGMSAKDRLLGLMMIANGIAFLIGAAVYWLTYRIEQSQLDSRERFLQLELRLAELCETLAKNAGNK